MSRSRWTFRRRRATALAAVLAAAAGAVLGLAPTSHSEQGGATHPVAVLGPADAQMRLMGEATDAGDGEAWGYRQLPADTPPAVAGGRAVEIAPPIPNSDSRQLAFLRYTGATGWQIFETPVDRDGKTYRGPDPNPLSPRITPKAGGVLVGRDVRRPSDDQAVLLVRDPGGRFSERTVPAPAASGTPPTPVAPLATGESIATDQGAGRVAVSAFDGADGKTNLFLGALGPDKETAILRYDGTRFTREPIALPDSTTKSRILAIDATEAGNAFALVETDAQGPNGIELYRRVGIADTAQWTKVGLGAGGAPFADAADPSRGIEGVAALRGLADPLTVTSRGVWVDGALRVRPAGSTADAPEHTFTLFFDVDRGTVTGSFCDAVDNAGKTICDHPLGAAFDASVGYQSIAFPGDGFGTRIVTNPLDVGGTPESNRGTYLRFDGTAFERRRGATGAQRTTAAFRSIDDGWLEGPVRISTEGRPDRLRRWPVALRSPLTAVTPAPGAAPASTESQALAVGSDGSVARYVPGTGWTREFLLTSNGSVTRPRLRGVAWPEAGRAHAVGDNGAMWLWRADTGLWEKDPATPIGFEGQLMDVAFQPGSPERGFAVGRAGTLLRYDKTWTQEALPAEANGVDLTSVGFAGGQALVAAGRNLLVDDGAGWRVDDQVRSLLSGLPGAQLRVVRGLPDGAAVAGGNGFVLERDGAGQPWRFADQPLPAQTVVAIAPFRAGPRVRAVLSVVPRIPFPQFTDPVQLDPDLPPPILPAQPIPPDGYLLRESDGGWRDEQGTAYEATSIDRPIKSDPILGLLVDGDGDGWAVGGWGGDPDSAGRGTPVAADRARVQTGAVFRYRAGAAPEAPAGQSASAVATAPGPVRIAVGGNPACETACADRADLDLLPDRVLSRALDQAQAIAAQPGGPRFFVNTGGRLDPSGGQHLDAREAGRYAQLAASRPGLPVFTAPAQADTSGGDASAFEAAFASAAAPFGSEAPAAGITTAGVPGLGTAPGAGARTHFAFDSGTDDQRLRTIVIDNSAGSLAASDPHQNPREAQLPWLQAVLADAKARGITTIVVGNRDLSRFTPRLNSATDGDEVAQALVDGGASAYFYDRPEENRALRIPSGADRTIPAFGTGSLGYRSPLRDSGGQDVPVSTFGDKEFLLAEIDVAKRDPQTNVAPVGVRGVPILEDLALQPLDGTLLRRSRPSLFQGLARRPQSGDRWGESSGDAGPSPSGSDPYTVLPPELCVSAGCSTRIAPEFAFSSSNPDIGDFVRQDPDSTNLRKPFIDPATDKVVTDASSGLFCPFNAGTTTVTLQTGGLTMTQKVTVLAGSALRPCGTRPLVDPPVAAVAPAAPQIAAPDLPEPPVSPPPPPPPPVIPLPPVPAVVPPAPAAKPKPKPATPKPSPPAPAFVPALPFVPPVSTGAPPSVPPPPAAGFTSTIPPGGVTVRVLEEKREEEAAPEQSQAFSAYDPDERRVPMGPLTIGGAVLLALAGATVRNRPRTGRRRPAVARATVRSTDHPYRRTR